MSSLSFSREIPVRHEVDVFVAGGGPAGAAAAVAAARQGASVYLAEGQASFGGMGTAGMVPAFMQFGDGVNFLAGGIGREIYDCLWDAGGAGPRDRRDEGRCTCGIRAEVLKRVYDELVTAESQIRFTFLTQVVAVEHAGGRIHAAVCWGKSGLFAVRARMFVDGTGDGDLAAWAGAPFEKGDPGGVMMPGTLCSLWANIDWEAAWASPVKPYDRLQQAIADGVFTQPDRHLPGIWPVSPTCGGGNINHLFGIDGTDERSVTEGMLTGRRIIPEYERFYKQYLKGYERMELVGSGALPGIRETRRITGDYVLGMEDFHRRATFDDEIGRYSYPVDIHPASTDPADFDKFKAEFTTLRLGEGESYGIPYRCLRPRGLSNVLVAGRCVSTDRAMQASIRVMPGCYITGQAAGVAAALAAGRDCDSRKVPVGELQKRLKAMGGYLPNA
ncbi:MAG TPA: FAD-dependent oxidoreductase [Phycisphaerae bacterium]|nr:FAD-dependent oxidoreductase [Phycisphaerae bacterium]HUT61997.1 FAD-dependent oxidoreductase [Phycisphaerae bacterium]